MPLSAENKNKLNSIFSNSEISTRYSCIEDYQKQRIEGPLYETEFPHKIPGMTKRNKIYKEQAPILAHNVAEKAIQQWGGKLDEITHLISVSCTGMIAPGIEFSLVDSLTLPRTVNRLGINFMGCFGAFRGFSVARSIANEDENNRILLVCTELCSLHFQANETVHTFIENSLFF